MKKVIFLGAILALMTGSAYAADAVVMDRSTEVPVIHTVKNWTGFYAGVSTGYVHSNASVKDSGAGVPPGPFKYHGNGWSGSGRVGYNHEFPNHVVVGVEGEVGYMDPRTHGIIGSSHAAHHQNLTVGSGVYGDVTGRLGYSFGRVLVYGKGGVAMFNGRANQATTNPGYSATRTGTFTGWTAGAGVEYKVSEKVSVDLGYQHFDFGHANGHQTALVADPPTPAGQRFPNRHKLTADMVTVGLTYHF